MILPDEIHKIIYDYTILINQINKIDLPDEWNFLTLEDYNPTNYWKIHIPCINLIQYFRQEYNYNQTLFDNEPQLIFIIEIYMLNIINYRKFVNNYSSGQDLVHEYVAYNRNLEYSMKKRDDCINHLLLVRKNFCKFNILINRFRDDINQDLYNLFYYLPDGNKDKFFFEIKNDEINRIRSKNMQLFTQSLSNVNKMSFINVINCLVKYYHIKSLYYLNLFFDLQDLETILHILQKKDETISYNQLKFLKNYVKIQNYKDDNIMQINSQIFKFNLYGNKNLLVTSVLD